MLVSVIIAAKDSEAWISRTLNSLLNQTYQSWECIVSINGSRDSTKDIVSSVDDKRFRIIESEIPNKSLALNRAIISANGTFISILDADDLWTSNKLEQQMQHVSRSNSDIIGTQISYINENEEKIANAPVLPIQHEDCVEWLNKGINPIANSSVLYVKNLHDKVGFYDPEKFVEDYDMWMRSMRRGLTFANLTEVHLLHRVHQNSHFNSSSKQQHHKRIVDIINVLYSTPQ